MLHAEFVTYELLLNIWNSIDASSTIRSKNIHYYSQWKFIICLNIIQESYDLF